MATPACRARSSNDATAGTSCSRHFGWRAQMCSMTSKTSNAVVAGSITTGAGSGGDGICSVSKGLLMENPPNARCLAALSCRPAISLLRLSHNLDRREAYIMQPLRYYINVTLDGCCDHREMFADAELHRHAAEHLDRADALLFGRVTYEMMEAAWG